MSREIYRHAIEILRRDEEAAESGGYACDVYRTIGRTSCQIRDESETEYATAESTHIEHVRTFTMRARDVRSDDLIRWRGETYKVRRNDGVYNLGREILVRASLSTSKYTVAG